MSIERCFNPPEHRLTMEEALFQFTLLLSEAARLSTEEQRRVGALDPPATNVVDDTKAVSY